MAFFVGAGPPVWSRSSVTSGRVDTYTIGSSDVHPATVTGDWIIVTVRWYHSATAINQPSPTLPGFTLLGTYAPFVAQRMRMFAAQASPGLLPAIVSMNWGPAWSERVVVQCYTVRGGNITPAWASSTSAAPAATRLPATSWNVLTVNPDDFVMAIGWNWNFPSLTNPTTDLPSVDTPNGFSLLHKDNEIKQDRPLPVLLNMTQTLEPSPANFSIPLPPGAVNGDIIHIHLTALTSGVNALVRWSAPGFTTEIVGTTQSSSWQGGGAVLGFIAGVVNTADWPLPITRRIEGSPPPPDPVTQSAARVAHFRMPSGSEYPPVAEPTYRGGTLTSAGPSATSITLAGGTDIPDPRHSYLFGVWIESGGLEASTVSTVAGASMEILGTWPALSSSMGGMALVRRVSTGFSLMVAPPSPTMTKPSGTGLRAIGMEYEYGVQNDWWFDGAVSVLGRSFADPDVYPGPRWVKTVGSGGSRGAQAVAIRFGLYVPPLGRGRRGLGLIR